MRADTGQAAEGGPRGRMAPMHRRAAVRLVIVFDSYSTCFSEYEYLAFLDVRISNPNRTFLRSLVLCTMYYIVVCGTILYSSVRSS
jgi:hypothetical protein